MAGNTMGENATVLHASDAERQSLLAGGDPAPEKNTDSERVVPETRQVTSSRVRGPWRNVMIFVVGLGFAIVTLWMVSGWGSSDPSTQIVGAAMEGGRQKSRAVENLGWCNYVRQTSSTNFHHLQQCANEAVNTHINTIMQNLQANSVHNLDLLWPGTGFNEAAYAGNWEVLSLIQKRFPRRFRIGRIMGASGGSSSAIMALSDRDSSARTMVDGLLKMAAIIRDEWRQVTTADEIRIYEDAMARQGTFNRVKTMGFTAVWSTKFPLKTTYIHNFAGPRQAAQAFAVSGNVFGWTSGGYSTSVNGLDGSVCPCQDGGIIQPVPGSQNSVLFYNTAYGKEASITDQQVSQMFVDGVDATIEMLLKRNLWNPKQDFFGNVVAGAMGIKNPVNQWNVRTTWSAALYQSLFYNILITGGSSTNAELVDASRRR